MSSVVEPPWETTEAAESESDWADWPEIDLSRCEGCAKCVAVCPTGAFALVDGHAAIRARALCEHCAECEAICPHGAIRCAYEIVFLEAVG